MIKAILFDLDGVLVDACEWHYYALNRALREVCDFVIDRDDHIANFNGLPTKVKLAKLISDGRIKQEDVDLIVEKKQKYTLETIYSNSEVDFKKSALLHLFILDKIRIGCVTNCIKRTAIAMLKATDILYNIQYLVSNEDATPKPAPDGYIKAMNFFNVTPSETLIIEDSPRGLEAANKTGAHVLHVKNASEVTWKNIVGKILEIEKCES